MDSKFKVVGPDLAESKLPANDQIVMPRDGIIPAGQELTPKSWSHGTEFKFRNLSLNLKF